VRYKPKFLHDEQNGFCFDLEVFERKSWVVDIAQRDKITLKTVFLVKLQ
jgi:hypothetical protein